MKKTTQTQWMFALLIAIVVLGGCNKEKPQESEFVEGDKLDIQADASFYADMFKIPDSLYDKPSMMIVSLDTGSTGIPQSREELEDMKMVMKMFKGSTNRGVKVPGFGGITLGENEANLNVYYIETKIVQDTVYGIGYSLHYLFKKVKRGLSLRNIPLIAASAQMETSKTEVYYSIQSYGIAGTNLVRYFKPQVNKNFNVEGFGVMQSSIDGIHNILGDTTLSKHVRFTPRKMKFIKPADLEDF